MSFMFPEIFDPTCHYAIFEQTTSMSSMTKHLIIWFCSHSLDQCGKIYQTSGHAIAQHVGAIINEKENIRYCIGLILTKQFFKTTFIEPTQKFEFEKEIWSEVAPKWKFDFLDEEEVFPNPTSDLDEIVDRSDVGEIVFNSKEE